MPVQPKEVTKYAKDFNNAYLSEPPFDDKRDFEDTQRGFLSIL